MSRALGPHRKHSRRDPCPVCGGKTSFCLTFADGWTLCGRHESERQAGLGWLHWTANGLPPERSDWRDRLPAPAPIPLRSTLAITPEMRDQVFRAWIALASLTPAHRRHLRERGFSDEQIAANGYASHPAERLQRRTIATALLDQFGSAVMEQTPGFYYRDERNGERHPTLAGPAGVLIPSRDAAGRIQAFQARADTPGAGGRYKWVSSRDLPGGTGSGAPAHVAYAAGEACGHPIALVGVTEGPLKADLVAVTEGLTTVALGGVSAQKDLAATVKALSPQTVLMIFDADADTNKHVLPQRNRAALTLAALGCDVQLVSWVTTRGADGKPGPKGVDDAIRAGVSLDAAPYPFPHSSRLATIPPEAVPVASPRPLHTLADARDAHVQTIRNLIVRHEPGFTTISSTVGTGKTYGAAQAIRDLRASQDWPRIADGKGGTRRARFLYLAQTKQLVADFAALTGGNATIVEGRNPDPNHPWGCYRPVLIRLAGEGRHNPARDVCAACLDENEALAGKGWRCPYLQAKAAAESATVVAATLGSFLNASEEIDQFDIIIVDEAVLPSLVERIVLTSKRADEWLARMDTLAAQGNADLWGINSPFRRFVSMIKLALAQVDVAAHDWLPAAPALGVIERDVARAD